MNEKNLTDLDRLDMAWAAIEKAITRLGVLIRHEPFNNNPQQRYEAYKAALSLIAESYVNQVHYDRKRPECLPTFGSLFNYAGPIPDYIFRAIHIEPGKAYRVWGKRGDAEIIDVQQSIGWFGQNPEKRSVEVVANHLFDEQNIELGDDGGFDFILAPVARDGQWWPLHERATTLFIREYFTDYATQGKTSTFHFDPLEPDAGTTPVEVHEGSLRFMAFANALRDFEFTFTMPTLLARTGENRFEDLKFSDGATPTDQTYFKLRFNVKPYEALVGKWVVPESCLYWSISLNSDTFQVLNYGNRQINLNHRMATVGADRVFHFVLSHKDPGIANWLDLDGHETGILTKRTKRATAFGAPTVTLVPFDELKKHLPADLERVSAEQRAESLAVRRRHFHLRESR